MAMRVETNPLEAAYAALIEHGLDGAAEALRILVNEAAKIERAEYLGARPYERTATRRDYANGYKPKTMLTRLGEVTFQVPQVRSGDFYPSVLEKGTRTDQAIHIALAEMYVQGVSTRRVIEVLQKLLGPEISLSTAQVSRAAAKLDEGLKAWRERPLGEVPYLFLDARYEKVRLEGRIHDCAVLIAVGIEACGKRRVLGCEVATSEAETKKRRFLEKLLARGLKGVKLIIADDHAGLKAARRAVLPAVPWQRCQFHLQQNAGQFVTRQEARKSVAAQLRAIFYPLADFWTPTLSSPTWSSLLVV
jgi:transposase-like protein